MALLLDAGAWRESFNHAGMTPLHLASAKGDTESCLRLIATGVEVSLSDFQGRSPVSLAKAKVKPDLSL